MAAMMRAGPSKKPGVPPGSSTWMSGAQGLLPYSAAFPGTLVGAGSEVEY